MQEVDRYKCKQNPRLRGKYSDGQLNPQPSKKWMSPSLEAELYLTIHHPTPAPITSSFFFFFCLFQRQKIKTQELEEKKKTKKEKSDGKLERKSGCGVSHTYVQQLMRSETWAKKQSSSLAVMSAPELAVTSLPFCLYICSSSHFSSTPGTKY